MGTGRLCKVAHGLPHLRSPRPFPAFLLSLALVLLKLPTGVVAARLEPRPIVQVTSKEPLNQRLNSAVIKLSKLNISPEDVTAQGCSNQGDFAHQLHIAFSSLIGNACVYAGQPYHCAVSKWPRDYQVKQTPESSVPHCSGCSPNRTLAYDHCKNHPQNVDVGQLPDYPRRACGDNATDCIDDAKHLFSARVFLFHGTFDRCYLPGAVANVEALYAQMITDPTVQMKFVDDQPFPHCLPQNSTPFWGHAEPSNYDGPGECLRWIYGQEEPLGWATDIDPANLHVFDQAEFIDAEMAGTGISNQSTGVIYIPTACKDGKAKCKLLTAVGGSGCDKLAAFTESELEFLRYTETNNMVMVKVCPKGGQVDIARYPNSNEIQRGELDVYGQLGPGYALQSAPMMRLVGRVLKRLLHGI